MLCDKCANIHFKRPSEFEPHQRLPKFLTRTLRISGCVFYFHHASERLLRESADEGCHFCEMIHGKFFGRSESGNCLASTSEVEEDGGVVLRRSVIEKWIDEEENGLSEWNKGDWIYITCGALRATTESLSGYEGEIAAMLQALTGSTSQGGSELLQSVSVEDTASQLSHSRLTRLRHLLPSKEPLLYSHWMDVSTISPASMVLASIWLKDCLDNHQPCKQSQMSATLPTRVIDVSDPDQPLLTCGDGKEEEYLTLSYKWGIGRRYTLTKGNESALKKTIPLQKLPTTFKDAIYVTHMLGFRWLWIDALCIVQDDKEDQEREMGVMDSIFRCSTMTLFASAGDNADAGLGAVRDPRWIKPCLLNLKTTLDGETVQGSAYISIDGREPHSRPLRSRGWCLQEEILAIRGLVFDSLELSFRCLCGHSQESRPQCRGRVETVDQLGSEGYNSRREYSEGWDGFNLLRMWIMKRDPLPRRTLWQRNNQFDHWYDMVKNFSGRQLSFSEDVLPAVSGLARAMYKTHQCTYLSGLWQEDLQVGLAWYVIKGGRIQDTHGVKSTAMSDEAGQKRPSFPSWSWTSQYGKRIDFRGWENNHRLIKTAGCADASLYKHKGQQQSRRFLEVTVPKLILSGRIKPALMVQRYHDMPHHSQQDRNREDDGLALFGYTVLDPDTAAPIGRVAADSAMLCSSEPMYCFLCTAREKYREWQLTCLALRPLDHSHETFVRIGLVFLYKTDWFGRVDPVSTSLVDSGYSRTVRIV